MNKELACKVASSYTDLSTVEQCQLANEICTDYIKPFSRSDIAQIGFVEWARDNCTDRELALIKAWTLLEQCYRMIHISWKTLKEAPTTVDKNDVTACFNALKLLGIEHLLGDPADVAAFLDA